MNTILELQVTEHIFADVNRGVKTSFMRILKYSIAKFKKKYLYILKVVKVLVRNALHCIKNVEMRLSFCCQVITWGGGSVN